MQVHLWAQFELFGTDLFNFLLAEKRKQCINKPMFFSVL